MLLAQSRVLHGRAGWLAFLFPVLSPTAILGRAFLLTQAAAAATIHKHTELDDI